MSVSFLQRVHAPAIAYKRTKGENAALPTVVFLHGLRSDMEGTKAVYLHDACAASGQSFLRFDCCGHGASEGKFEEGTIGLWKQDALDVIDSLTEGSLILVGSSMGGWLALLVALARPDRVAGLIGLAAAPDFTRAIEGRISEDQRVELRDHGIFRVGGGEGWEPLPITRTLLEDGENHCLLTGPIALHCPVRLIQGMKDADVPWQTAHRLANAITGADTQVYLREQGDHRLSAPNDLELLVKLTAELSSPH